MNRKPSAPCTPGWSGVPQACGGTATGEHGVGLGKKAFMQAEHGAALDVMRRLKATMDPKNILNPGKMFDP